MENLPEYGNLRLAVKDFGPIARAEIDLRPLTVFIGPSNTGKSYLSILIYALHSIFQENSRNSDSDNPFRHFPPIEYYIPNDKHDLEDQVENEVMETLSTWLESGILQKKKSKNITPALVNFPTKFSHIIREIIREVDFDYDYVNEEMCRCFGMEDDMEHFKRYGTKTIPTISIRKYIKLASNNMLDCGYNISLDESDEGFSSFIPDETPLYFGGRISRAMRRFARFTIRSHPPDGGIGRKILTHELVDDVANTTISSIVAPLNRSAFYLPTDRAGVMHAHRAVVAALIGQASRAGLRRAPELPLVSGVLADFLEALITMGDPPHSRRRRGRSRVGDLESLASDLEKSVLGGTVQAEPSETGYPSFYYRPNDWETVLPLTTTSSMVSELAPVVLFLRHLVRKGDTLIIEEPESHLHPELQAAFACHLARLARSGIRVIVTTHSEWLLDQFANLVRMSDLSETERNGLPGADAALSPDQFGAWLFKPRQSPRGSVVEEIRIDPDAGGLTRDYSDTADQLFGSWAEIGNRIADRAGTDKG